MPGIWSTQCYIVFGCTGGASDDCDTKLWTIAVFTSEAVAKATVKRLEEVVEELGLDEDPALPADSRIRLLNNRLGLTAANFSLDGLEFWYDNCVLNPYPEKLS